MSALNLAILIGLALLFAAGYTWIVFDIGKVKEDIEQQGETNRLLWESLQRQIDAYRKPEYEKAGERE